MLKRLELAILAGVIVGVIFSSFSAFAGESQQIRQEVFRLHLLANSDSAADQALKISVRDAVPAHRSELFAGEMTRQEVARLTGDHLDEIQQTAQAEVWRQGYDYPVSAQIVNMYFETRQYADGFILPAGRYDAVRVTIGQGEGENWWCIMFPPMCIPAAQPGESDLELQISQLGESPGYRPKFAVVEIIESLRG